MFHSAPEFDRRDVLRSAGGIFALLTGSCLLGGCGSGDAAPSSEPVTVVPGAGSTAAAAAPLVVAKPEKSWMNFALVLQYVGAQFYSVAANGSGISSSNLTGAGVQGALQGGRQVTFVDPDLAQYAREFAADQLAMITQMRIELGAAAGAQPTIDLSANAFAGIGQATSLGSGFDPFASDASFLIGGLIIEYAVAAAYRGMLTAKVVGDAVDILTSAMGDSVYRNGLIRARLAAKSQDDTALSSRVTAVFDALAHLEGSNSTSQDPTLIGQASSGVNDGDGHVIALTRSANEVFRVMYLNATGVSGGLLPAGANGVDLLPGLS